MFVVHGRNIAPRVHLWSTMVRMLSYPLLLGSLVMRSIAIWVNGGAFSGTDILYSGVRGWCMRFLFCWQMAHPLTYYSSHWRAPGQRYCHCIFHMVSSLLGCLLLSCQFPAISFLISSSGGITNLSVVMLLHPQYSSPGIKWIGNRSSHHSIVSLWRCWVSMMRRSSDPLESASKMFRNTDSGMRASSWSSSVMSAPFGCDNASARVLVFLCTWIILKL